MRCPMPPRATARSTPRAALVAAAAIFIVGACGGPAGSPSTAPAGTTAAASSPAALETATTAPLVATTSPAPGPPSAPTCAAQPAGIVAWWRAENDPIDAVGSDDGTLKGGATFATGTVGTAFSFDGKDQYVEVSSAPNLQLASAITIEGWVYPSGAPAAY